jgi:NDP-sugar pyrophosphorylase family protein
MIPIVILCGGLATRLYPTTKTIPKSLIMIEDTPFISYQLDLLYKKGITDVILCVGKFGKMIEDYVGDGSFWGLRVKYSYEDESNLLGTGGAIKNAIKLLPDEFMILYGDSYLDVDYKKIIERFYETHKTMLMTVYKNPYWYHKNNVTFKDGEILKYDKKHVWKDMEYIEYGITISKKYIIKDYPDTKFDLSELMSKLVYYKDVSAYEIFERYYEIGSEEGIREFKNKLGLYNNITK